MAIASEQSTLLRTADVARLLGVSRSTVCRWARVGKLSFVSTPGGHRRYRVEEVNALLGKPDQASNSLAQLG
jgi:excisionase family DNA binding protein